MRRTCLALGCGVLALALCGCPSKPKPPPVAGDGGSPAAASGAPAPRFDRARTQELLELRHRALGELENHKFAACEQTLQTLAKALPEDGFVLTNLAICRQLDFLENADAVRNPAGFAAARGAAEEALARLSAARPDSFLPHLLRARVLVKVDDRPAAEAALRRATELAPREVAAWYDLYALLRNSPEEAAKARALAAGRKLYELQPDNWLLLKDWIIDVVQHQDPQAESVLQFARAEFLPLGPSLKRDVRADPIEFLDKALDDLRAGRRPEARRSVTFASNLARTEAAIDAPRINRHALEFVARDFDKSFYERADLAPPTETAALPLTFEASLAVIGGVDGAQIRQLECVDVDLDGREELLALGPDRLQIYAQGATVAEWSVKWEISLPGDFTGLAAADFDNDGDAAAAPAPGRDALKAAPKSPEQCHLADPDLVLYGPAGVFVLENRWGADGARSFVARTQDVPWSELRNVHQTILADLDHDGDLDLCTTADSGVDIWSYRGDFRFERISDRSNLPPADARFTTLAAVDWDRDADSDVVLAGSQAGLAILENLRHGRFRYRPLEDLELRVHADGGRIVIGDLDGGGSWDVVGPGGDALHVLWTEPSLAPDGWPKAKSRTALPAASPRHVLLADFDNDGATDLLAASADGALLFRSRGPAQFALERALTGNWAAQAGALAASDIDRDGDVDVWQAGPEGVTAHRNDGGNANHWIEVRVRAQLDKGGTLGNSLRVNHEAIGSLIELRAGDRYQAALVNGQVTRFGLGQARQADVLRIIFTNGVPQNVIAPQRDQVICEEQLPYGSCPYVYVWNGAQFEFYTDCLWNAPIGLKFAEDVVAPWREWEYLKIDGSRLRPRGDEYVLQVSEELWEIAYYDQIQLFAIDHPAGTQICTNEKVGPADLARHQIHTVRTARSPVAARDAQGQDVLPLVRETDGQFARTYERRLASGLATDHFLELDLGDLRGAKKVMLFLTGWLYPTDSSMRVQMSQHPTLPSPRPPSLWAPGPDGAWREVRPFLGFPGGKTKTIAVDVSDVFAGEDYRLRIATNMELYWDAAFITVDEAPVEYREQELPLVRADLHYRGFSQAVHRPGYGPETYDYQRCNRHPRWSPLKGDFTRYGDVTELLRRRDDRLAVLGSGDECTVAFGLPEQPLPEGWVRDFVLYNVGWDKDAAQHTVFGTTVEPLPFEAMTTYAHRDGEPRPVDAAYQRYLDVYQTRRQLPATFWGLLRQREVPQDLIPNLRFEDGKGE